MPTQGKHRQWSDADRARIVHLYRHCGMTYAAVARVMGCNHSSVGLVIRTEDAREEAELVRREQQGSVDAEYSDTSDLAWLDRLAESLPDE